MEITLSYWGPASTTGHTVKKFELRRNFHNQLINFHSYALDRGIARSKVFPPENRRIVEDFVFLPLVTMNSGLLVDVNFTILSEHEPGHNLSYPTGDTDNLVKGLLDGLRMARNKNETRDQKPRKGEDPFYVLMEDDLSVSRISVVHDRLLFPRPTHRGQKEIFVLIKATIYPKFGPVFQ